MTRAQRPAPLRDAGNRTKLALIAGAGVLGMLVVADAGIRGLGSVRDHTAGIATSRAGRAVELSQSETRWSDRVRMIRGRTRLPQAPWPTPRRTVWRTRRPSRRQGRTG